MERPRRAVSCEEKMSKKPLILGFQVLNPAMTNTQNYYCYTFFPFSEHSDSHEGFFNGRPPRKTAQLTPPVSKNPQNVHQNTFNVSLFLKIRFGLCKYRT